MLSLTEAYDAVRSGAGVVVDRPGRGLIRLTGEQRIWFLQNTITAEVEDVAEGRWVESCFLELKGHVVARFRVGILPGEVWLDIDPPGTGDLLDWFVRYRFRTKVDIEDRSTGCATTLGAPARTIVEDGRVLEQGPTFGGAVGDVPAADVFGTASSPNLAAAPGELYEVLRIEAGIGRFGVDYGPANLPQEAGLTSVVSVTKGCYVGQEVMARIHFRGHANRSVRRLDFREVTDAEGLVGRELLRGDQRVGTVTSAIVSPATGPVGIGMVRLSVDPGETLTVTGGGVAVTGDVPAGTKRPAK